MLTIFEKCNRYCDGISRRSFLRIGALGVGAGSLSLADIFRADAATGKSGGRHKAVINIFLAGGPPHQDMWDIKTDAPVEIRGEFKPISTSVAGIQIGEMFPLIAARMEKFAVIRSIADARGNHDAVQCMSGWPEEDLKNIGGRPSIGAVVAKVQGPVDPALPPSIGLSAPCQYRPWADPGTPGFLGKSFAPFQPEGDGLSDLKLRNMTLQELGDRRRLISSFDSLRHDIDSLRDVNSIQERAFAVLTSSRLVEALDLSRENEKVRARYGDGKPYKYRFDGPPTVNDQLLLARRLVEAGVRCVTLSYGRWDNHDANFVRVRDHGPKLDQGLRDRETIIWSTILVVRNDRIVPISMKLGGC